jgi:hypothetical protein
MQPWDKRFPVQRLWSAPDGTVCLLAIHETPPMYSITIVRGQDVLRERRLYDRASAQMMAEGWSEGTAA